MSVSWFVRHLHDMSKITTEKKDETKYKWTWSWDIVVVDCRSRFLFKILTPLYYTFNTPIPTNIRWFYFHFEQLTIFNQTTDRLTIYPSDPLHEANEWRITKIMKNYIFTTEMNGFSVQQFEFLCFVYNNVQQNIWCNRRHWWNVC